MGSNQSRPDATQVVVAAGWGGIEFDGEYDNLEVAVGSLIGAVRNFLKHHGAAMRVGTTVKLPNFTLMFRDGTRYKEVEARVDRALSDLQARMPTYKFWQSTRVHERSAAAAVADKADNSWWKGALIGAGVGLLVAVVVVGVCVAIACSGGLAAAGALAVGATEAVTVGMATATATATVAGASITAVSLSVAGTAATVAAGVAIGAGVGGGIGYAMGDAAELPAQTPGMELDVYIQKTADAPPAAPNPPANVVPVGVQQPPAVPMEA